jgi:hypothetical protein
VVAKQVTSRPTTTAETTSYQAKRKTNVSQGRK